MTILVTGSRGKTALPLTELLLAGNYPVLVAARTARDSPPTVRFDWYDRSTWQNAFSHLQATKSPITAAYIVGPDNPDTVSDQVIAFLHFAKEQGVKRIVLLSAWEIPPGGILMGRAHAELERMGHHEGMEWAVLRPNFFMDNFRTAYHLESMKKEGKLYTGADDGKLAFIAAQDIAAVAYRALTNEKPLNVATVLTGPQALSHDEVAATFSKVLGRRIEHVRKTRAEFEEMLVEDGLDRRMAGYMADLDVRVSKDEGREVTTAVYDVTGKEPTSFEQHISANSALWA